MEITENKLVGLIDEVAVEVTENELTVELSDEHLDYVFDVTAEGLAMSFDGIPEDDLDQFFADYFSYYSTNTIYKTEAGYYLVTLL